MMVATMDSRDTARQEVAESSLPRTPSERLIAAAADLFYRRGFQAVSVNEIADEAGIAKITLYRHFPSKDALAATCLERTGAAELGRYHAIAQRLPGDPLAQLRAIAADIAERITTPGFRGWFLTNLAVELADAAHPVRRVADSYKARTRALFLALAEAAGARRPRALANTLMLLAEGAAVSRQTFAGEGPSVCLIDAFEGALAAHRLIGLQEAPDAYAEDCLPEKDSR